MFKIHKTALKNGVRLIFVPMENTSTATISILVGVGSRYERKGEGGISHFLEHLFFKGSKNNPKPIDVSKSFDKLGGTFNAFTSKETTGFWIKVGRDDFTAGLNLLGDIFLNPIFDKAEIDKERGVILQEIDMYRDQPQMRVSEILENNLFRGNKLANDIIGTKKVISSIRRDVIIRHRKDHYTAENIVVAVAGACDHEKVFRELNKMFSNVPKGRCQKTPTPGNAQRSARVALVNKDSDQSHLAIGFLGVGMRDNTSYAQQVLATILGGNSSSQLFTEIREKRGLAYYVRALSDEYNDIGYLGISAGVPHDRREDVVKIVFKTIARIREEGVTKTELASAKHYLRRRLALRLETSDELATEASLEELVHNRFIQPEEYVEKIESVSQDDILKLAKRLFTGKHTSLAFVGPITDADEEKRYRTLLNI